MNKLFSFLAIILFSLQLSGQLVLRPDTADVYFPRDTSYYDLHMTVTNNYNGPVSFWWRLEKSGTFPSTWSTQVCDMNTCYFENVDKCPKHNPNTIAAGASSDAMYIKFLPRGAEGTTSLWFRLYSDADLTNQVDSILINVSTATSALEDLALQQISLFPNPSKDYFTLKGEDHLVRQIEVFDITGKLMQRFIASPGRNYPVSRLPSGSYFVRLQDSQEKTFKTLRLHKE